MRSLRSTVAILIIAALATLLVACGSSGGSSSVPGGGGTPGGVLSLSPTSIAVTTNAATTFVVTDNVYTGPFAVNTAAQGCQILTVTPGTAQGPSATFTVKPVAAGSCTLVISENNGHHASLPITITFTQGTIQ